MGEKSLHSAVCLMSGRVAQCPSCPTDAATSQGSCLRIRTADGLDILRLLNIKSFESVAGEVQVSRGESQHPKILGTGA